MARRRPILSLLIAAIVLTGCSDHAQRSFNADEWKQADTLSSRVRGEMLDDLLSRYSLMGLTRAQVISRLGEPTRTDKFGDWTLVYVTGPVGLDDEWLVLRLDEHGRVSEQRVTGD